MCAEVLEVLVDVRTDVIIVSLLHLAESSQYWFGKHLQIFEIN